MRYLVICALFFTLNTYAEQYQGPAYGKKRSDFYFTERRRLERSGLAGKYRRKKFKSYEANLNDSQPAPLGSRNGYPVRDRRLSQNQSTEPGYAVASRDYPARNNTHYMAIMGGFFVSEKAHRWGSNSTEEDVGSWNMGVTYQIGEWVNSMDLLFRGDVQSYTVEGESPKKLSLLGMVAFPDVKSGFPLYFGAGAGLGVFFEQTDDESNLSIDYQIVVGGRIPKIFNDIGVVIEGGAKNHLFLTSKGQFNGYFLNAGAVFNF